MADLLVAKKSGEIPAAQRWDVLFARAAIVLSCLACVTIVWGVVFGEGFTSAQMLPLFVGTGMLISLVFMAKRQQVFCKAPAGLLGMFTASLCALYVGIILVATPYLNRGGSTETILRRIAEQSSGADAEVGVITRNTFSHYWVALASQNELPKPLKINFLEPDEVGEITNVLVKRKDFHRLPAGVLGIYHERLTYGAWVWLEKGASHKD